MNVALWGLYDDGSHRLIYLNIWSLVGETLGKGLRCMALLEEKYDWRQTMRFQEICTIPTVSL